MGGIGIATAVSAGTTALNLMNQTAANNRQMKYLQQQRQAAAQQKKNLLEQQLASRRAGLGAMGVTSSKSAAAVQKRLAQDTYNNISDESRSFENQYENLRRENQHNLLGTLISTTGKLIK